MICSDGDAYTLDLYVRSDESGQCNLWCRWASKSGVTGLAY